MTTAELIAARFDNDGQNWQDAEGNDLFDVLREEAATVGYAVSNRRYDEMDPESGPAYIEVSASDARDYCRFVFEDGSAIVTSDGGWDIEGDEPFQWAGA